MPESPTDECYPAWYSFRKKVKLDFRGILYETVLHSLIFQCLFLIVIPNLHIRFCTKILKWVIFPKLLSRSSSKRQHPVLQIALADINGSPPMFVTFNPEQVLVITFNAKAYPWWVHYVRPISLCGNWLHFIFVCGLTV